MGEFKEKFERVKRQNNGPSKTDANIFARNGKTKHDIYIILMLRNFVIEYISESFVLTRAVVSNIFETEKICRGKEERSFHILERDFDKIVLNMSWSDEGWIIFIFFISYF